MKVSGQKVERLLTRNVEQVIERDHLGKALAAGEKLRIKLGIDPTSPDLHLGHAVILRKLKEFQELGHKIVLIIGDFTGKIGDPSGRVEARKPLTDAEVKKNMKHYLAQAGKVIDVKKAEIVYNGAWFLKAGVQKILELASAGSIQQVLRRAEFKKRLDDGRDITLLETFYPLFQGYDSVMVKADVEVGGTDQTFNLLMGRRVQRHFGMKEQDILTTPLLEGLDGVKKMSKSLGNYIGLTDSPDNMFGKIMSLPDVLMGRYFMLCTDIEEYEIADLTKKLSPRDLKARLAFEIVKIYHGEKEAEGAEEKFTNVFSKKEVATITDFPALEIDTAREWRIDDLLIKSKVVATKSTARRLVRQRAIRRNGIKILNPFTCDKWKDGDILQIGRHHFFRVASE